MRLWIRVLLTLVLASPAADAGEDLAKRYRATMNWSQYGLTWTSTPEDVWRLKSFAFEFGRDFEISCGEATVVFGVHETNVLWAVVFPLESAKIEAGLYPGQGEEAETILLRFAPAEIGRVFPKKTVDGHGDPWLRSEADRIFRHKVGWKWYTPSGNPTIVQAGWTLIDVETTTGKRRFYGVDAGGGNVEYVTEFEAKPLPELQTINSEEAVAAFDEVWQAFDTEYAKFGRLKGLDWAKLRDEYREHANRAKTTFRLAAVLADMLAHLEDLHVWVKAGDDSLPGYTRPRPLNANWTASTGLIGTTRKIGEDLFIGRTEDGIGYMNIDGLSDPELPEQADEALEVLGDTWALVIDLRFNGGGDETLAQAVTARLINEEQVYSKNQYRSGPAHEDLGEVLERKVGPRGPWRYEAPVVVLLGQKTLSSAESFALMLAQCPQVTTMGDRTGGSSANPRRIELECGVTANLPRWLDMDPDGNPIEGDGVAPDVKVKAAPEDFSDTNDPVLKSALKRLRKISKGKRKPGRQE